MALRDLVCCGGNTGPGGSGVTYTLSEEDGVITLNGSNGTTSPVTVPCTCDLTPENRWIFHDFFSYEDPNNPGQCLSGRVYRLRDVDNEPVLTGGLPTEEYRDNNEQVVADPASLTNCPGC